ncbi:MAG: chalcone isomerase family protein [Pirellulales bacterium]|nr:chalcone isomerase family protein [Pirellulales bacterium]
MSNKSTISKMLYLAQPSSEPAAIVAADAPMAIRLEITWGLVTEDKLAESLNEGFRNATGGKPEPIRKEIDLFRKCLAGKIAKGDVLDLAYLPGHGVIIAKNGKQQGVVQGLAFKQALFGVWLSSNPADKDLKRAMLLAKGDGGQTALK